MTRILTSFALLGLLSLLIVANGVVTVYAWDLVVNPTSKTIPPGGSGSFSIAVTGTIPGNPNVQLLISPPVLGITAAFTTNNVPAPFMSTMVVSVDPSKAPGSYVLEVWAHPAGEPFPGPTNDYANVNIIVGAPFDFSIQLSPPAITVKQGETAHYQILISYSDPSYSGTSITVDAPIPGPGMNVQLVQYPPALNVLTSQSTPPGSYTVVLTGSAGGNVHQTSAALNVQPAEQPFDFSVSASPPQQTIAPGGSTTYGIQVHLVAGSAQNVVLTVNGAPSGVSTSLNPTSGNPTFSSILTISTASSLAPGQYVMTVQGTAGAVTRSTTVTLIVGQAPDFRIDVSPPSQSSAQGQTTSYSINVVGLNGFNSQVSLSVSGLPPGVNAVFTIPSSTPTFSTTLTLSIPSNSPTGTFTLAITGSGSGITRVANVVLNINPGQTQTTTTQTGEPATGLLDLLQQNSLIIIGLLALLVVLLAALAMRRRGSGTPPSQGRYGKAVVMPRAAGGSAGENICGKCGANNLPAAAFCSSCGNKLR